MAGNALSRRRFLGAVARATAGTALAPLGLLEAGRAGAAPPPCFHVGTSTGFGPLAPRLAQNGRDLVGTIFGDLSATPLLAVPPGFVYTAFSITGDTMSDGGRVPGDHDGMACFRGTRGRSILVRNHELGPGENEFGSRAGVRPANGRLYDPFNLPAGQAGGGTTTLVVDGDGRLLRSRASLGGTSRNCAGGPTPWGSWISCEEDVRIPFFDPTVTKRHGYCFEVPSRGEGLVDPIPIVGAGRFNHEAVAVDPDTSIVYETEDRSDSCIYRYVSHRRADRFGHLQDGGSLHALAVDPGVFSDCDGTPIPTLAVGGGVHAVDTRRGVRSFLGQPLPVSWVPLDDVDPAFDTLRVEARTKGAALFDRGEGAWFDRGRFHFAATSGGDDDNGQIWAYDPGRETLTLLFESPDSAVLDHPDNITLGRDGTLYVCEDGSGSDRVVGIDRRGALFELVRNVLDDGELAGVCFSYDNRFLFLNAQGLGITFAVFRQDRRPISIRRFRREQAVRDRRAERRRRELGPV